MIVMMMRRWTADTTMIIIRVWDQEKKGVLWPK